MSQTRQLVDALKRVLKSRGLTYAEVATRLGISEASVKRLFSRHSFTLQRLEAICDLADTNVYELARLTPMREGQQPRVLSLAQEQALAEDPVMLSCFYLLLNGWPTAQIRTRLDIDAAAARQLLDTLVQLELVTPGRRGQVQLRTSRRIEWRRNGPVRRIYEQAVKTRFLDTAFTGPDERLDFDSAELSDRSIRRLGEKMRRLQREFDELAELDLDLPRSRKRGFALLGALRAWTFWPLVLQRDR